MPEQSISIPFEYIISMIAFLVGVSGALVGGLVFMFRRNEKKEKAILEVNRAYVEVTKDHTEVVKNNNELIRRLPEMIMLHMKAYKEL